MMNEINITCSVCGKTSNIPEYNKQGIPWFYFICECREETELNPRRMNSKAWEWAWEALIPDIKREFGDNVANRLVAYIIERRNYYIKDRKHPLEDALEPQSLKEV